MSEQLMPDPPGDAAPETVVIRFTHFARPGWFQDAYHSTMLVRFATSVGLRRDELLEKRDFPLTLAFDRPVAVGVVEMASGALPVTEALMFGGHDGQLTIEFRQREIDVPKGIFISIRTPLVVDGFDTGYQAAVERLDAAAGLVSMHAGRNFIRDIVFEGVFSGETSGWSLYSSAIRMPAPWEGPYIEAGLWGLVEEAAGAAANSAMEVRDRITLALEFIGRALRSPEPFLFYWTAFEVLSGKAGSIRSDLAKAYGLTRDQHVDLATGFGKISELRHRMIHSGVHVKLSASMERYIQLLLIDIIRLKLALEPQGHAIGFQNLAHVPLAEIGVSQDWRRIFPS
jgi:hypothetical protein